MPKYRITTKQRVDVNGVRIDSDTSVEVTNCMSNSVLVNGRQQVADAVSSIYRADVKNGTYMVFIFLWEHMID